MKEPLIGKTLEELRDIVTDLGMPKFTGGQIAKWLYSDHVMSIDDMTNISKANRQKLSEQFTIGAISFKEELTSKDGTKKYLFPVSCKDGNEEGYNKCVESVYIPDRDRATLCISCQVGCKMNCLFCQTGKQGYEGSLATSDIINQIYSLPDQDKLTNIVFMGQGEPMDNLEAVIKATEVLTAEWGYGWSPRRITVSSVGTPKLKFFLDNSECHVAISMHTPIHEQRMQIMPAEKMFPIKNVIELLRKYDFSGQRRLSFEYIVFNNFNDSMTHAREIVKLLDGLDCRMNLIRFHQIPGIDLKASDEKKMERMRDYLTAHGIFTTIRASRGQDILAACGLLSTKDRQI